MSQSSRREILLRRNAIAVVLAERGWSASILAELMETWSLSRAQIYKEKRAIMADLAEATNQIPVEEKRAEIIEMIRGVIADARREGDHGAALSGIRLLSQISGVWSAPPPVVVAVSGQTLTGADALRQLEERIGAAGLRGGPVLDLSEDHYESG